jgi:general secretion pathway protein G
MIILLTENGIKMTKSITIKQTDEKAVAGRGDVGQIANIRLVRGFTLLELLVVMVIIGLLAAYVGPKYFTQLGKSEITIVKAQIEAFSKSLDTFRLDVGRYPTSEEGLSALVSKPASAAKWNGPYLQKEAPPDPWGHVFLYKSPGSKGEYEILSYGKDGQPGGAGENADITN